LQGVEGADPAHRQSDHHAEPPADRGPVVRKMPPRKRQYDQERCPPPDKGQRDRRNMPRRAAADDGVAGPEQRGQAEQRIGLIRKPGKRRAWRRSGGQWVIFDRRRKGRSCARNRQRRKACAGIGPMHRDGPWALSAPSWNRRAVLDSTMPSRSISAGSKPAGMQRKTALPASILQPQRDV
jgi:hypothetical protein